MNVLRESSTGCLAIVGTRGCGKSTLARRIISTERRVVVVDTMAEHVQSAWPVSLAFDGGFLQFISNKRFKVGVRPSDEDDFERICNTVETMNDVTFVIDEADIHLKSGGSAWGVPPSLNNIVQLGRHYGQRLVVIARRPAALPRSITAQCAYAIFATREPADIRYAKNLGVEEDIRGLAIGDYYFVDGMKLEKRKNTA